MVYMWRALPGEAYKTLCVVCRTVMHRVTSVCTVFDTSLSGSGSPLNFLKGQVGMCLGVCLIPGTTLLEIWTLVFFAEGAQLSRINEVRSNVLNFIQHRRSFLEDRTLQLTHVARV